MSCPLNWPGTGLRPASSLAQVQRREGKRRTPPYLTEALSPLFCVFFHLAPLPSLALTHIVSTQSVTSSPPPARDHRYDDAPDRHPARGPRSMRRRLQALCTVPCRSPTQTPASLVIPCVWPRVASTAGHCTSDPKPRRGFSSLHSPNQGHARSSWLSKHAEAAVRTE